jgi:hypothetical protein
VTLVPNLTGETSVKNIPIPELYPPMTPQAEKDTQDARVYNRRVQETVPGSFKWITWSNAGDKVHALVENKNPKMYDSIVKYQRFIDIAVSDIDKDDLPDVVVYYWNACTAKGCPYEIYFGNSVKNIASFFGRDIIQYRNGVILDGTYYEL